MPHTTTLPIPPTTLIGREQEVATLRVLLNREEVRLLTLTGPGGTGKTRLGLKLVAEHDEAFPDGVYFVNLAPVRDPEFVLSAIAQALTLREAGTQSLFDLLTLFLRAKHLLLLLDNFEQVLEAAPQIANLLALCPHLKMVVTSRERLHVQGEQEFAVPPLTVPKPEHLSDLVTFSQYEAVKLFIQRTQTVKPDFEVTHANASAIADICIRLDGLPLAIELAAARSKLLPPQALLARLGHRFAILTSGSRDVPMRQQTLRNTIAWSYDLLDADEQRLFRRLSVFVGGCTLEAIETICTALDGDNGGGQVLDCVASLLDKSLLRQTEQEGGESRFWMLETLREYGQESLTDSGEMDATCLAHAMYFLHLSEEAEPAFQGPQEVDWLECFEREYGNVRAALSWLIERDEDKQRIEIALRLGGSLWWFWSEKFHMWEGQTFLEQALTRSEGVAVSIHAKALMAAGNLAGQMGNAERGETLCKESLARFREIGDMTGVGYSIFNLGIVATWGGDIAGGRSLFEESLAVLKQAGNKFGTAWLLFFLANADLLLGEYSRAYSRAEESLTLFKELGAKSGAIDALGLLATMHLYVRSDVAKAQTLLEESLALARYVTKKKGRVLANLGDVFFHQGNTRMARSFLEQSIITIGEDAYEQREKAWSLTLLAKVASVEGNHAMARDFYEQNLAITRGLGFKFDPPDLEGFASVVAAQGELLWAAQLWGAAEVLRETSTTRMLPLERTHYERAVTATRTQLGEHAFSAAWAEGRTMTPEQALASEGQDKNPIPITTIVTLPARVTSSMVYPDGLTTREAEVLRLLATGLTNAQVAEQLIISPRTVDSHLTSIYSKIGVSTRSAATRYALDHHLV